MTQEDIIAPMGATNDIPTLRGAEYELAQNLITRKPDCEKHEKQRKNILD